MDPDALSTKFAGVVKQQSQSGQWIPYRGPQGGEGWQNVETHEVRYQQDPPGEAVEGYDDYWREADGHYDEEAWSEATDGWKRSPGDIPEGTEIAFETWDGVETEGVVTDVRYGQAFENFDNDPASLIVETDEGAEFRVPADRFLGVTDYPDGEGYYDEAAWQEAFADEGWSSPAEVPRGTKIHYVQTGNHYEGRVRDFEFGANRPGADPSPASLEVEEGNGFNSYVPPDMIEGALELPHEAGGVNDGWGPEPPDLEDVHPESEVLYEGEDGIHETGTVEGVTVDEGERTALELRDGTIVGPEDLVAVDEAPAPLEPREEPYEFDSTRDRFDLGPTEIGWDTSLEHTPFDSPGEVPTGVTARIDADGHPDAVNIDGAIDGEVVGYWEGDAEIGEPNGLEVETPEIGTVVVFPEDLLGFVGPDGFDTAQHLSMPFKHASEIVSARDAGIGDGNTTGATMKILEMPDGARVFATPVNAYNSITTGVVDGPKEARENNLNSPIMIEHLGGNACATDTARGDDGRDYIVKEGIDGDLLKKRAFGTDWGEHEGAVDSLERTLASAFFVGNMDLHGANVMVNLENDEAFIIDHDNAGPGYNGWMDIRNVVSQPASHNNVREEVHDIGRAFMTREIEVPDELEGTKHEEYMKDAIRSLADNSVHEELFEEWDSDPFGAPENFQSMDDFEEGMEVTVFDEDKARVLTGELTGQYQGKWYGETDDNYELSFDTTFDVLEVDNIPDDHNTEANTEYNPQLPEGYQRFEDFDEGDVLHVDRDGSTETVVVDDANSMGTMVDVRDPETDETFTVFDMRDIEGVKPSEEVAQ